jgi:transcription initiation factor TFIIIB Brf1 subunit/transcription initiation factor TFIIB
LGWTQREIAEKLDVTERTVRDDTGKNCNLAKISGTLGPGWNEQEIADTAKRLDVDITDGYAAAMQRLESGGRETTR